MTRTKLHLRHFDEMMMMSALN